MPERSAAGSPGVGRPLAGRAGTSGAPQARFPALWDTTPAQNTPHFGSERAGSRRTRQAHLRRDDRRQPP